MTNIEEKITQLQNASKRLVTIEFDGSNFVIKDDEEVIAKDDTLIPALEAAIKYFANHLRANIENIAADISEHDIKEIINKAYKDCAGLIIVLDENGNVANI